MFLPVSLSSPTKCQWCSTLTTCTRSLPSSPTAMNTSLQARRRRTCPRRFWTQRRVRHFPPGLFSLLAVRQTLRPVCLHPQVFPGLLTHRSSLPTTPCLLGRWDPLLTPWAGSCRSKFYSQQHTHTHQTLMMVAAITHIVYHSVERFWVSGVCASPGKKENIGGICLSLCFCSSDERVCAGVWCQARLIWSVHSPHLCVSQAGPAHVLHPSGGIPSPLPSTSHECIHVQVSRSPPTGGHRIPAASVSR